MMGCTWASTTKGACLLEAVNTQQPRHSSPKALPSLGRGPSPSWTQMAGWGGRMPLHLAETPASMAAATAWSMAAFAAVLVLGTRTVQLYFGSPWGLL